MKPERVRHMAEVLAHTAFSEIGVQGCGLARAHAKAGDVEQVSGYLGRGSAFDDAVARFALAYAEQNARDYEALRRAIAA